MGGISAMICFVIGRTTLRATTSTAGATSRRRQAGRETAIATIAAGARSGKTTIGLRDDIATSRYESIIGCISTLNPVTVDSRGCVASCTGTTSSISTKTAISGNGIATGARTRGRISTQGVAANRVARSVATRTGTTVAASAIARSGIATGRRGISALTMTAIATIATDTTGCRRNLAG